jgi:PQQ-dependent dehydrogenase (s-GDH family)
MKRLAVRFSLTVLFSLSLPGQDGPETVMRGPKQFRRTVLASGLRNPWEMTWGPDSMLWVTERTGKRITRIDPSTGKTSVAITVDEVSAPGSQDGLLGMALHPDLLKGSGNDYVYVGYTYVDAHLPLNPAIFNASEAYRHLYGKIVRLTYHLATHVLSDSVDLITGLPVGNDHVSGRLKIGPDRKLYYTIGDQGHNQLGNFCLPIQAQRLPTAAEIGKKDYAAYVGKSLRLNLDGSIPRDNPRLNGVVSHIYTYGHRNMQGIDFGPDGTLYASEQGPKTDDEINILKPGANYGWPHVAGLKDNKAYEYARWADSTIPCMQLTFSDLAIPPSVPREAESAFTKPFAEPIATMFTVPSDYNFQSPACKGVDFICWPTVGASSIEYYASKGTGIPGWDKTLLITTLKRGSLYVLPLTPDGQRAAGHMWRYFQSENRYRDTAVHPNGKTIYIATDVAGLGEALSGGPNNKMADPGAILAFTYVGEDGEMTAATSIAAVKTQSGASSNGAAASGAPPSFTAAQAAAGKVAYNANCAACHGNTMTNGTFAPPLAGEYFRDKWAGKTVGAFYVHVKTMPPSAPSSLPDTTYANIVAYLLGSNGFQPGKIALPPSGAMLEKMTISPRTRRQ